MPSGLIFRPNVFSLSIGINYEHKANKLGPFCWNDADLFDIKMIEHFGGIDPYTNSILYPEENRFRLRESQATFVNIKNAFTNLKNLLTSDIYRDAFNLVFIYYSGHGFLTTDDNSDEAEELNQFPNPIITSKFNDELIVGYEFDIDFRIRDDWIRQNFLRLLPSETRVMVIMDNCHSGTIMDLKYLWQTTRSTNVSINFQNNVNIPANDLQCKCLCITSSRDDQESVTVPEQLPCFNECKILITSVNPTTGESRLFVLGNGNSTQGYPFGWVTVNNDLAMKRKSPIWKKALEPVDLTVNGDLKPAIACFGKYIFLTKDSKNHYYSNNHGTSFTKITSFLDLSSSIANATTSSILTNPETCYAQSENKFWIGGSSTGSSRVVRVTLRASDQKWTLERIISNSSFTCTRLYGLPNNPNIVYAIGFRNVNSVIKPALFRIDDGSSVKDCNSSFDAITDLQLGKITGILVKLSLQGNKEIITIVGENKSIAPIKLFMYEITFNTSTATFETTIIEKLFSNEIRQKITPRNLYEYDNRQYILGKGGFCFRNLNLNLVDQMAWTPVFFENSNIEFKTIVFVPNSDPPVFLVGGYDNIRKNSLWFMDFMGNLQPLGNSLFTTNIFHGDLLFSMFKEDNTDSFSTWLVKFQRDIVDNYKLVNTMNVCISSSFLYGSSNVQDSFIEDQFKGYVQGSLLPNISFQSLYKSSVGFNNNNILNDWILITNPLENSFKPIAIAAGDTSIVCIGENNNPCTIAINEMNDGESWNLVYSSLFNVKNTDICYGNGKFVTLANPLDSSDNSFLVNVSSDGIAWSTRQAASQLNWSSIAYGNGYYVAVSNNNIMRSSV